MALVFRYLSLIVISMVAANAAAHRYFFSISDIKLNVEQQRIEIIHQLTAHDFDNAIAENHQIHFSTEHPEYEKFAQQYLQQHFQLSLAGKKMNLQWLGLEIQRGNIIVYQEATFTPKHLSGIEIYNNILLDNYLNQVNTVNFQDKQRKGSLTFTKSATIKKIVMNK